MRKWKKKDHLNGTSYFHAIKRIRFINDIFKKLVSDSNDMNLIEHV